MLRTSLPSIPRKFVAVNRPIDGSGHIGGNLTIKKNNTFDDVQTFLYPVDGNLTVENNKSGASFKVVESTVARNVVVKHNTAGDTIFVGSFFISEGGDADFTGHTVQSNLLVEENTAGEDIKVRDNTTEGNLVCENNEPDPIASGNEVEGNINCGD